MIKDKNGIVTGEVLTKKWTDWIDYWSVDFDFEHKREIVRVKNEATGEMEEVWTGDFIFENEWQSFRTKKDRSLELKTPFHECLPRRYKVAVKGGGYLRKRHDEDHRGERMSRTDRETVLQEMRRLKPQLERAYGVTKIGIFGSLARNEARDDSDVDVVVEMQPDLMKRARLRTELESVFRRRVDVVRYWRGMNRFLKKRIDDEALYV